MENDQQVREQADTAILAGDHWLRQNGIVSDFSLNTILAYIYLNYPSTQNVELDLDKEKQRLYVRVYFSFWKLLWLFLTGKRQRVIENLFAWLCDYLPTYQVSLEIKRAKEKKADSITPRSKNPDLNPADLNQFGET